MDNSTYDKLVAGFYRAATGAIEWNDALESVRIAFKARCAPVQTLDLRSGNLIALHVGGPDMDRPALEYLREYHPIDPRAKIVLGRPVGEWVHCNDYLDDEFVANDRFFQEYLPSFDSRYVSAVAVPVDPHTLSFLGIHRPASCGPLDEEERLWARRLGEQLREALLAYERVRKLAAQALAGHALLSTFPYPMWLIDAERYVFFANSMAQREQQDEKRVSLHGPRLVLRDSGADRALTQQITALQAAGHGSSMALDLRRSQSDPPTWLHLSLLIPGQVLGAFGDRPQVLATLFDPRQVSSLDPFALANMFSLTPTEAKVATQIAEGLVPDEIALRNGTRVCTVRSQLSSVLAKLGVSRQADVVRLLRQGEALWSKVPQAA